MMTRPPSSWLTSVRFPSHHDQLWLGGMGPSGAETWTQMPSDPVVRLPFISCAYRSEPVRS